MERWKKPTNYLSCNRHLEAKEIVDVVFNSGDRCLTWWLCRDPNAPNQWCEIPESVSKNQSSSKCTIHLPPRCKHDINLLKASSNPLKWNWVHEIENNKIILRRIIPPVYWFFWVRLSLYRSQPFSPQHKRRKKEVGCLIIRTKLKAITSLKSNETKPKKTKVNLKTKLNQT